MLNATLRADGSSKFSKENRWSIFPSVSAGWVISNENFMESSNNVIDILKLRASWGQVGNQSVDNFQYAATINTSTDYTSDYYNNAAYYVFGTGGVNVPGAYPNRLANPELKWETSEQINLGVDMNLFKNRLSVNADFYIKTTKDWIVNAPILATSGAGSPFINGGDVKNSGFELALNWNHNIGKLRYTVGVNGSYNKNEVGKIPTLDGIIHGPTGMLYDNSDEFYRSENGHAIGYFWGYETAGIFQNQQEIDDWKAAGNGILQPKVVPGDVKFVDQDNNGIINSNDKTDLGNGMAKVNLGFNIGLQYKGFDLGIDGVASLGSKIVQSYRNHTNKQANYTKAILQRWTGEGTSNSMPRVTETNLNWQFSDLYIHNGDYLRCNNITLGYDFAKLIRVKNISQCRLYTSVQNAFTFTKYDGMDPEIGYGTDGWVNNIDLGYYPRPTTFLVGVNLKF